MKNILMCLLATAFSALSFGQMVNPVHFTSQLRQLEGANAEIEFTATIDNGWHVYSTDLGNDGPISATFTAVKMDGAEPVGKLQTRGKETKQFDKMFDMELRFFEHKACFVQKIRFTKPTYTIDCYLEYGACNDEMCMPPMQVEFKQQGKSPATDPEKSKVEVDKKAEDEAKVEEATVHDTVAVTDTTAAADSSLFTLPSSLQDALWTPVIDEMKALGAGDSLTDHSLLYILLMGFVGGLLAVMMPCIWPIIPMTVSFFLKRSKSDKRKGIRDAITYGISIIVIYLGLGLLVTAFFGSDTLNAMSTNAVFNIFLFLLLVVFALSFFGWFEIKLPGSWTTKVDQKSEELSAKAAANSQLSTLNSQLAIFLMAFTLVLVSFSCTAPIIGLLLVETTTSGNWLAPALGMFGFALALALPFTLFALFPTWLKQAPKSGSWMTTLKVVLGFIELLEISLRSRSGLRLAYPRPRSVPLAMVCYLRPARSLPLWLAEIPGRRHHGQWSMVNDQWPSSHARAMHHGRTCITGFRHLYGTRFVGCPL